MQETPTTTMPDSSIHCSKLEDGSKNKESLEDVKASLDNPENPEPGPKVEKIVKKRRRRRKKVEVVEPALPEGVSQALVKGVTSYIASRGGSKWEATAAECKAIGTCLEQVIEKYAPAAQAYGPEIGLLLTVSAYAFSRVDLTFPKPSPVPTTKPDKPKPGVRPGYNTADIEGV